MPRIRRHSVLPIAMTTLLLLSGCGSLYDETKGWGVDLWEGLKKGSTQAVNATKEALDSVNDSSENTDANSHSEETSAEIETTLLQPLKTQEQGTTTDTSTPAPLKTSEKMAQPPEAMVKGHYAVHLSSNKTKQSAEREWVELTNAFPKEIKGLKLQLRLVDISGKGRFYRVLGTIFETKSAANKACDLFKKKKQYCVSLKL